VARLHHVCICQSCTKVEQQRCILSVDITEETLDRRLGTTMSQACRVDVVAWDVSWRGGAAALAAFALGASAQPTVSTTDGPAQEDESSSTDQGSTTHSSDVVLWATVVLGVVAVAVILGAFLFRRHRKRSDELALVRPPDEPVKDGDAIAYHAMPFGGHKRYWDKVAREATTQLGGTRTQDNHIYIDVRPEPGERGCVLIMSTRAHVESWQCSASALPCDAATSTIFVPFECGRVSCLYYFACSKQ
jgi:hypothetical protein